METMLKLLERAQMFERTSSDDRELLGIMLAVIGELRNDAQLIHAAAAFLVGYRHSILNLRMAPPIFMLRDMRLIDSWHRVWSIVEPPTRSRWSGSYEGTDTLGDYILSSILRAHSVSTSTTRAHGTVPAKPTSTDAGSAYTPIPSALKKRYDDQVVHLIRQAKTCLKSCTWSANSRKNACLQMVQKLASNRRDAKSDRFKMGVQPATHDVVRLLDEHAVKHYSLAQNRKKCLAVMLRNLRDDEALARKVCDVLADAEITSDLVKTRSFVRLLVEAGANSLWKHANQKTRPLAAAKPSGVHLRLGMKVAALNQS